MYKIKDITIIEHNIKDTEIKKSPIHGYGLFATKDLNEGETLCILDGQYLSEDIIENINIDLERQELNYITSEKKWLVRGFLSDYSAINHSAINHNIKIENNPLKIKAIKKIKRGEEILINYKKEKFPENFIKKYNVATDYLGT